MLRSMFTGISGVKSHQTMLDVVGNNISNVNTVGFKKSVVIFQDLLYQTIKGATAPTGARGGVNAMQIGLGTKVAAIQQVHTQGAPQSTGNPTDMAIQGDGYFIVRDGGNTFYTRAGNFVMDSNGYLVHGGTGYLLQGYAVHVNETTGEEEVSGTLGDVLIPVGSKLEARATENMWFKCNLDARVDSFVPMGFNEKDIELEYSLFLSNLSATNVNVTFDEMETNFSTNGLLQITFKPAGLTSAAVLKLFPNGYDEATGDIKYVLSSDVGTVSSGGAVYFDLDGDATNDIRVFMTGDTMVVQNLTAAGGNNMYRYDIGDIDDFAYGTFQVTTAGAEAQYLFDMDEGTNGNMLLKIIEIDTAGAMHIDVLTVLMNNDGTFREILVPTAMTTRAFDSSVIGISTNGKAITFKDLYDDTQTLTIQQRETSMTTSKIDVYDSEGRPYTVEFMYRKIDNNKWEWRAYLPDNPSIPISNNYGIVEFDKDGLIKDNQNPTEPLTIYPPGAEPIRINLDFDGINSKQEGITQFGSEFTTKPYRQDGYAMGVLQSFNVAQDGSVVGVYSNGQRKTLYKIALALFNNPSGLEQIGDTVFAKTSNSGEPQINLPQSGGAGSIMGGMLEMSNVDLSEEFVRLILAQRGFQANARVITTSDQILEELLAMKR